MKKKITAVVLCIAVFFSFCTVTTSAADSENPALMRVLDKAVNAIVGGIASIIRDPGWARQGEEDKTGFMPGMQAKDFTRTPAQDAKWSVGYASRSLQTGDELDGEHYVGGSLSVSRKVATAVYDDQRVRTAAISDGRSIAVFASLDAYGFSNPDVCAIRAELADYSPVKGCMVIRPYGYTMW